MAPFGCEPCIVEIQPTDHGADIESRMNGIELPIGAGNARAIMQ